MNTKHSLTSKETFSKVLAADQNSAVTERATRGSFGDSAVTTRATRESFLRISFEFKIHNSKFESQVKFCSQSRPKKKPEKYLTWGIKASYD